MLGILVFHAFPSALPGGFIGVDIFFVLSGFLIASIMIQEHRKGVFSFREFYLKRVQRLIPNAVLTVLVTLLLLAVLLPASFALRTADLAVAALLGLSNVYLWRYVAGGYWGVTASAYPLLHTWALSVEIQFYVFFPVIMWLLLRRSKRQMISVVMLLTLLSFALSIILSQTKPEAVFYLLPTRAWQLLLGVTLAAAWLREERRQIMSARTRRILNNLASLGGLAMILAGFALISNGQQLFGLVALVPATGAMLLIVAATQGSGWVVALLSSRPAAGMGRMSYSLYLWHFPLIFIGVTYAQIADWPHYAGVLGGVAAGILLSLVAYRWVETPLRKRGLGRRTKLIFIGAGYVAALVSVALLSTRQPEYDSEDLFDQVVFRGRGYDLLQTEAINTNTVLIGSRYADVFLPPFDVLAPESWNEGGVVHPYGGPTPRVVLIGDSHATMYAGQVDDICEQLEISVAFLAIGGNQVYEPRGRYDVASLGDFYAVRNQWIDRWKPDAVIVVDRWTTIDDQASFADDLHRFVEGLHSSAHTVILLNQVPELRLGDSLNLREYVNWQYERHGAVPAIGTSGQEEIRKTLNAAVQEEAESGTGVEVIQADKVFTISQDSVRYYEGRKFFYADDDHLSEAGATLLRPAIAAAISEACGLRNSVDTTR